MTCKQKGCTKEATHTVYWPNQITQQCEEHARKVQELGKHMGIQVPVVFHNTQVPPDKDEAL